jgi:pimeloyl-ACP methyl ester carboxylesterase
MPDYSAITAKLTTEITAQEDALPLFSEACRSRFMLHPQPTSKVFLFFHGFTAGPYQFDPLGKTLFRRGDNVLIPLMPGHGKAGDWNKDNPPPLPTDPQVYLKFAVQWLKLAQQLGDRVIVGGLSGGGSLASWLALEQANVVDRAILFAPYLSSSSRVLDLFVRNVESYFEWIEVKGPSYRGFAVPALRAFLLIGQYNLKRARKAPIAPMFIISSESDRAVNNRDHNTLFESALKHQPKCWYHRFDRVLDIPHTMMTAGEGNEYEHLLNTMALAFINSDLNWAEVEEIAYQMTKGKTFDTVVAELKLEARVSPEMPAMITMVDKWSITVKRELETRRRSYDR